MKIKFNKCNSVDDGPHPAIAFPVREANATMRQRPTSTPSCEDRPPPQWAVQESKTVRLPGSAGNGISRHGQTLPTGPCNLSNESLYFRTDIRIFTEGVVYFPLIRHPLRQCQTWGWPIFVHLLALKNSFVC